MKITRHEGEKELVRISCSPEKAVGFSVTESTLSCTGPTILEIAFRRGILHELVIGTEFVQLTLAEEVR